VPATGGTAAGASLAVPHARGEQLLLCSNVKEFKPSFIEELVSTINLDSTICIPGCMKVRFTCNNHTSLIDSVGADIAVSWISVLGWCDNSVVMGILLTYKRIADTGRTIDFSLGVLRGR